MGDTITANNNEERKVLALMQEVKVITSHVLGSSALKNCHAKRNSWPDDGKRSSKLLCDN